MSIFLVSFFEPWFAPPQNERIKFDRRVHLQSFWEMERSPMSGASHFPPSLQQEESKFIVFMLLGLELFYNVSICKQQEIPLKLI